MATNKDIRELLKEAMDKIAQPIAEKDVAERAKWEPLRSKGFEVTIQMPEINKEDCAK